MGQPTTQVGTTTVNVKWQKSKIQFIEVTLLVITSSPQVLFCCWLSSKTTKSWTTQVWSSVLAEGQCLLRVPVVAGSHALIKLFCLFRHGMKSCRCKTRNRSFCAWIKENCLTAFVYFFSLIPFRRKMCTISLNRHFFTWTCQSVRFCLFWLFFLKVYTLLSFI